MKRNCSPQTLLVDRKLEKCYLLLLLKMEWNGIGCLGQWFNQNKCVVVCLRSAQSVWFVFQTRHENFQVHCHVRGHHQTWQEPLQNLWYPTSQASKTVSEVLGSNCTYFCHIFTQVKTLLNAGKTCFEDAKPLEGMVALSRIRSLCGIMLFNRFFIITLPPFYRLPPTPIALPYH